MMVLNLQHLSGSKSTGFFGLVCEFWFICLLNHFLFMVESSILCAPEVLGSFGCFFFFKAMLQSHILMFPGRTGWLFI